MRTLFSKIFSYYRILSTMPYFLASSALMKKSRSTSFSIFESGWPVFFAKILLRFSRIFNLLCGDFDISCAAFCAARWLMDHDFRISESKTLAFGAG